MFLDKNSSPSDIIITNVRHPRRCYNVQNCLYKKVRVAPSHWLTRVNTTVPPTVLLSHVLTLFSRRCHCTCLQPSVLRISQLQGMFISVCMCMSACVRAYVCVCVCVFASVRACVCVSV